MNRLAALPFAIAAACAFVPATSTNAAAPQVKTQAPGYYRMMLGDFEITALSDGTVALPMDKLLTQAAPGEVQAALDRAYLKLPLETSVNAFLVNTGSKLVLIDTGAAGLFGPTLGRLMLNLKAAGYSPEQVDEVYITHLHGDHMGGLLAADGKPAFPNAVLRMDKAEAEHWLSGEKMEKAAADDKPGFSRAMTTIKPYQDAGKLLTFNGPTQLVPGVSSIATPGHTPGHSVYAVESKGQKLLILGDLMHVAAVQFPNPAVTIAFDSDAKAAAPQRQKVFAEAAAQGHYLAIAHVSFPGLGRLRPNAKAGYDWMPLNYSSKP
ncbi:MBL fold metallo-hydrolase [Roseateles oligotrophus]|uniref:MBL fold metallo-hydrolase n=1 Tax=Roseateles oligotrophus TaxID=1769250 RepID=A0ABT2YLZ9_9BURK|nr:MBL fold metallo-hydrolase [Roseateles oligotrophus]MCV2371069.1 MBL fold metallo-hydrolase [Roseateles oligotrophus]